MNKFLSNQQVFIIVAVVLGFFLNRTNCTPDPFCDPDPLYGGCSNSCEFGTAIQWLTKSISMWVLLNIGAFIGRENLKKKENLRDFLNQENLKTTTRVIDEEWKIEDKKSEEAFQKAIKSLKLKS